VIVEGNSVDLEKLKEVFPNLDINQLMWCQIEFGVDTFVTIKTKHYVTKESKDA